MSNQSNTKTSRGKFNIAVTIIFILILEMGFPLCGNAQTEEQPITVDRYTQQSPKVKIKRQNKINVKLTWKKVKDAKGYMVYRKLIKKNTKYHKIKITTKTKFVDKKKFKKGYRYKIRAYKYDVNGIKVYTKFSKQKTAKCPIKGAFTVKAYAYHERGGVCANGQSCKVGRIATDPRVIPTGTWLYVNGYGLCKACDTGGDIKGRIVDLYMNSEGACNRWGVRYPKIYIFK